MKKLSLYVFLVLMLASCSEYKVKKALENCADQKFSVAPSRSKFLDLKADLANNARYSLLKSQLNFSIEKIYELDGDKKKGRRKYLEENPRPATPSLEEWLGIDSTLRPSTLESLSLEALEEMLEKLKEKKEGSKVVVLEYQEQLNKWKRNLEHITVFAENRIRAERRKKSRIEKKIQSIKNDLADKKYEKMNTEQKSKIPLYVNLYGKCEAEHKELPKHFLMKYQN